MRPYMLMAVGLSVFCLSRTALADVDIGISFGIPAPVYVAPPVVYEEVPPPPPVVYEVPPVVYAPGGVVYGDGQRSWREHQKRWQRHWKGDEDHRYWERARDQEDDEDD